MTRYCELGESEKETDRHTERREREKERERERERERITSFALIAKATQ